MVLSFLKLLKYFYFMIIKFFITNFLLILLIWIKIEWFNIFEIAGFILIPQIFLINLVFLIMLFIQKVRNSNLFLTIFASFVLCSIAFLMASYTFDKADLNLTISKIEKFITILSSIYAIILIFISTFLIVKKQKNNL